MQSVQQGREKVLMRKGRGSHAIAACGGTGHGPDKCFHKDKQFLKCKKGTLAEL